MDHSQALQHSWWWLLNPAQGGFGVPGPMAVSVTEGFLATWHNKAQQITEVTLFFNMCYSHAWLMIKLAAWWEWRLLLGPGGVKRSLGQQGKAPTSLMKVSWRLQGTMSVPALLQGTSGKWHHSSSDETDVPGWANCSLSAGGALPGKQQGPLRLCNPIQGCHLHLTQRADASGVPQSHKSASHKVLQEKGPGSTEGSCRQGKASCCMLRRILVSTLPGI